MVAKPGDAGVRVSVGAPGVCTAVGSGPKPPVSENSPPVIGPPASGWPMVPVTQVLTPQPLSRVAPARVKLRPEAVATPPRGSFKAGDRIRGFKERDGFVLMVGQR